MKKAYVYNYPECALTTNWHSGGGLLIVTAGDPQQVWLASTEHAEVKDEGNLGEPDHTFTVADDAPELMVIFPDAGCC